MGLSGREVGALRLPCLYGKGEGEQHKQKEGSNQNPGDFYQAFFQMRPP